VGFGDHPSRKYTPLGGKIEFVEREQRREVELVG